jgi:hypothetical protein
VLNLADLCAQYLFLVDLLLVSPGMLSALPVYLGKHVPLILHGSVNELPLQGQVFSQQILRLLQLLVCVGGAVLPVLLLDG